MQHPKAIEVMRWRRLRSNVRRLRRWAPLHPRACCCSAAASFFPSDPCLFCLLDPFLQPLFFFSFRHVSQSIRYGYHHFQSRRTIASGRGRQGRAGKRRQTQISRGRSPHQRRRWQSEGSRCSGSSTKTQRIGDTESKLCSADRCGDVRSIPQILLSLAPPSLSLMTLLLFFRCVRSSMPSRR